MSDPTEVLQGDVFPSHMLGSFPPAYDSLFHPLLLSYVIKPAGPMNQKVTAPIRRSAFVNDSSES